MAERKIKRALIAVYDKTGIIEFARALVDEFGIEIISTGGTAKHLKDAGIPVTLVEQVTGFPEMLDGRVKTLHPKIHAGILADRDNPNHMRQLKEQGIEPIDMVVVNLYPFEKTVADPNCTMEQAIEMIDIGGPCMLRAAAKNNKHVLVIVNRYMYQGSLAALRRATEKELLEKRLYHARIAFLTTWRYDRQIAAYIERCEFGNNEKDLLLRVEIPPADQFASLRYGENPHQLAELRASRAIRQNAPEIAPVIANCSDRDDVSFNNYVDADSALALCTELTKTRENKSAVCFIKHTNACGVGFATDAIEAYRRAYLGDPNAAMGGVLAVNFKVNAEFTTNVMQTYDRFGKAAGAGGFFIEVWVAPEFDDDAISIIRGQSELARGKKWGEKIRLFTVGLLSDKQEPEALEFKSISGGMLVQARDLLGLNEDQWKVVTKRPPTDSEMSDLRLAWLIAKHTKSNAISICKDGMLIGNGAGQMSRVMSCRIATWLAKENGHVEKLKGSAAASDAFFPFRDGPDILIDAGVTAIIQPGGSKRDEETIRACDERGVAMIFTGTRHFKH